MYLYAFVVFVCPVALSSVKETGVGKETYVQIKHGKVNIFQQLSVVFHRLAAREKHNNFFLDILLEEREQEQKPPI